MKKLYFVRFSRELRHIKHIKRIIYFLINITIIEKYYNFYFYVYKNYKLLTKAKQENINFINLIGSTNNQKINEIISCLVLRIEDLLPQKIKAYYLIGSYADGSSRVSSDIDILVVFKRKKIFNIEKIELVNLCKSFSKDFIMIDINCFTEKQFLSKDTGFNLSLKESSILLLGEDIREKVYMPSINDYITSKISTCLFVMKRVRPKLKYLSFSLDYPDYTKEFYGYEIKKVNDKNGREVVSTKDIVLIVCSGTAVIIALNTGRMPVGKKYIPEFYKDLVGDCWLDFIQEVFYYCRYKWNYFIPDDEIERKKLKKLCESTLAFENYLLTIYKKFLKNTESKYINSLIHYFEPNIAKEILEDI